MKPKTSSEPMNYLKLFGIAMAISVLFFLPYIIMDGGLFIYYGDFNVQQIPFYKLAHEAIQSGNFGWSWTTDLGANFIGSYSFYLIGNPFFWLTIPFPNDFVPYLMAPLMMLKLSCSAVTGYAFIRRFTKTSRFAMIGGLLYAFSGFNIYNIFFNHFLEVAVFFPLLLIALEEFVINRRRGVFALTVCLCCVVNYYFFVAEVIFTVIYFMVRLTSPEFRKGITVKSFIMLAFEAIIGLGAAMFLLLPSVLALMGNYRLEERLNGHNLLLYDRVQRYGHILESLFFPPDMPARPNFFPDSHSKWASVSAYLPLFSLSGVIVFFKSKKAKWLRLLLGLSLLMALVPVLNSMFQLFNYQFYTRWFFMPILLMALATVLVLEDTEVDYSFGVKATIGCMLAFATIGILPKSVDGELVFFQMPAYHERFWATVLFGVAGVFVAWLIWKLFRKERHYGRKMMIAVCVMSVVYSAFLLGLGKGNQTEVHNIVDLGLNGGENISLPEEETGFYRIDLYEAAIDNYGMFWEMPSMRTFHSVVPSSIINFYRSIGEDRGVKSTVGIDRLALRSLFSVKYLFASSAAEEPYLPNYTMIGTQNEFDVYENEDYIPMGFTYDYYVDEQKFESHPESMRDYLLLKAIYLTDEQIEKYGSILKEITYEEIPLTTSDELKALSQERRESSGESFEYDNGGFTSKITLEKENLVFFSVPYESGWTATVNGEPVDVEQVSIGFMAVLAPAGENIIRFNYQTPGLISGTLISVVCGLILLAYCLVIWRYRKKHPENRLRRSYHRLSVKNEQPVQAARAYQNFVTVQSELIQKNEQIEAEDNWEKPS